MRKLSVIAALITLAICGPSEDASAQLFRKHRRCTSLWYSRTQTEAASSQFREESERASLSPGTALEVRLETLAHEVERLGRQLASLRSELEVRKDAKVQRLVDDTRKAPLYESLKVVNARLVGGPFSVGDNVTIAYELKNTSGEELRIPLDNSFSRPFNLVGTRQHWIERRGSESTIAAIPPRIGRQGRKYAAGGSIIPASPTISPGESLRFQRRVSTSGYPAGRYTYYIEYKEIRGSVIQTVYVDFELH